MYPGHCFTADITECTLHTHTHTHTHTHYMNIALYTQTDIHTHCMMLDPDS